MNIHTLTTSLVDKYSLCMGLHFFVCLLFSYFAAKMMTLLCDSDDDMHQRPQEFTQKFRRQNFIFKVLSLDSVKISTTAVH